LSRTLRRLENDLGAVLFERTNGGTHPTIIGQEFLEAARKIIDYAEAATSRVKARSRGESGRIAVGVHVSLSAGNLRATLLEQYQRFPDVKTNLMDGSSEHLISEIANSGIDIAFIINSESRWRGKSIAVWSERVVVAVPENHQLSGRDCIQWRDLRDQPLLLPYRGPGREFDRLLACNLRYGEACNVQRHDVSLDRLLTLVGAGMGILLALEGATGATYPGVVFRELHEGDGPLRMDFSAIWREDNGNPSLHRLLDILRERYPDLS
jgi:DNA-binding transcriptional LysR family regulator